MKYTSGVEKDFCRVHSRMMIETKNKELFEILNYLLNNYADGVDVSKVHL